MNSAIYTPLASRMRPGTFDEFAGQSHLVAPGSAFRRAAEAGTLGSFILWGPPGVGKTTLAEIVALTSNSHFERVSAVTAGVADLRKVVDSAKARLAKPRTASGLFDEEATVATRTTLFIDEIHRFNKSQQDAILPFVEDGTLTLIGATTENPSFEVNPALLSRSRVYVLNALSDEELTGVVERARVSSVGLAGSVSINPDALTALVGLANGDARTALNILELCASLGAVIDLETLQSAVQQRSLLYDKSGEQHYDLISALHKSVRGSDADASIYWLVRMLESGEDPLYLARRIIRMASEDIGLADPHALNLCLAAQQTVHFLGMPEGALALSEAVIYLALAPKSNAVYLAYKQAQADVQETRNDPVPLHLRNAPTKLMKNLDYGKGYRYAHDYADGIVAQQNLPDALAGKSYYAPTDRGFEKKLGERMEYVRNKWRQAQESQQNQ